MNPGLSDSWTPALKHDCTKRLGSRGSGPSCESGVSPSQGKEGWALGASAVNCRRMMLSLTLSLPGRLGERQPFREARRTCAGTHSSMSTNLSGRKNGLCSPGRGEPGKEFREHLPRTPTGSEALGRSVRHRALVSSVR